MDALRELADLVENQAAIRECGGIPPLVSVLSSSTSSDDEARKSHNKQTQDQFRSVDPHGRSECTRDVSRRCVKDCLAICYGPEPLPVGPVSSVEAEAWSCWCSRSARHRSVQQGGHQEGATGGAAHLLPSARSALLRRAPGSRSVLRPTDLVTSLQDLTRLTTNSKPMRLPSPLAGWRHSAAPQVPPGPLRHGGAPLPLGFAAAPPPTPPPSLPPPHPAAAPPPPRAGRLPRRRRARRAPRPPGQPRPPLGAQRPAAHGAPPHRRQRPSPPRGRAAPQPRRPPSTPPQIRHVGAGPESRAAASCVDCVARLAEFSDDVRDEVRSVRSRTAVRGHLPGGNGVCLAAKPAAGRVGAPFELPPRGDGWTMMARCPSFLLVPCRRRASR